jgi:hypothetical protein
MERKEEILIIIDHLKKEVKENAKNMNEFKKFTRTQISEIREVTEEEIIEGLDFNISVSNEDFKNGSPKIGDMIARNPKNHNDQWLVAEQYFKDNFNRSKQSGI